MLKRTSVSLIAMVLAGTASAADFSPQVVTSTAAGSIAVLLAGTTNGFDGDMYVQPWDGTKYPVKAARDGGLQTAAVFKLPPIAESSNQPSTGPIVDVATGKCLSASQYPAPVQLQDCNGTLTQTWYFRYFDAAKKTFVLSDYTRLNALGTNDIVEGIGEDRGWPLYVEKYPASGTLTVVDAPTWTPGGRTWPAVPSTYSLLQPIENLRPIQ